MNFFLLLGAVTVLSGVACAADKIDIVIESFDKSQSGVGLLLHDRVCNTQLEVMHLRGEKPLNVSICADSSGFGDVLITRIGGKVIGHYWLKAGQRVTL